MFIYTIYKSINIINGKCYIGFASNFNKRKSQHKHNSNNINTDDYNCYFYKDIRKYDWCNFSWDILYQSKERDYTLKIMEKYFIEQFDTFNCGYNSTYAGEGCFGYKHTPEHIEYLKSRFNGKNNPMYGRKITFSEEHRKNLSIACSKVVKTPEQIAKRTHAVSRNWLLTDPAGHTFIQKNLKCFCRENQLNQSAMGKVAEENKQITKGGGVSS